MARRTTITSDRPISKRVGALRALGPFLRPYRVQVVLALIALAATSAISLIMPLAARRVVDNFDDGAGLLDEYFGAALLIQYQWVGCFLFRPRRGRRSQA